MGVGGSSSSSSPVNMTPKAFKELQGPFASVFASLLGFGPPGGPSNGTGWGPIGSNNNQTEYGSNGTSGGTPGGTNAGQFGGTGGTMGNPGSGSGGWQPSGQQWFGAQWNGGAGGGSPGGGADKPYLSNNRNPFQNVQTQEQPFSGWWQPAGTNGQFNPNQILSGIPKYQGQITSEIGANEQAILDQMMQAMGGGNGSTTAGPTQQAQDYLNQVMSGAFLPGEANQAGLTQFAQMLQGAAQTPGYNPNEVNPFLDAAIRAAQRPTLQGLEETLSRTLPGRFTEAGQFKQPGGSSAFDRAGAIATRGASDALADIATNLSYQSLEAERGRQFEAQEGARTREDAQLKSELDRIFGGREGERGRQNEAAGLTTTLQSQEVDNMVKNLQAQALPRLINEYGIERGIEQFNNQVNTLLATLGIAQGVTAPVVGQKSESSSAQLSLK